MPKDRYSIYLEGFSKRFIAINLKYARLRAEIDGKVNVAIRHQIASGLCDRKNIERRHLVLRAAFLDKINNKYDSEMKQLDQWQADTLQKLFPELN